MRDSLKQPVRVVMHLNGGFTKVVLEPTEGVGLADGGIYWDIPTEVIPPQLRQVGSRFTVISPYLTPEDDVESIRKSLQEIKIEASANL